MMRKETMLAVAGLAWLFGAGLVGATGGEATANNVITVDVRGLHNSKGLVDCYLYSGPAGFPQDPAKALRQVVAKVADAGATCRFAGVAPGRYAVGVVHDETSAGRLRRNVLGMPKDGVGASNNPVPRFGPPKYADASFSYDGGEKALTVRVVYLL